jgi:hypothetical protein
MGTATPNPENDPHFEARNKFGPEPYKRPTSTESRERLRAHRERIVLERPEWISVITVYNRAE